jgi:hypothetical protein
MGRISVLAVAALVLGSPGSGVAAVPVSGAQSVSLDAHGTLQSGCGSSCGALSVSGVDYGGGNAAFQAPDGTVYDALWTLWGSRVSGTLNDQGNSPICALVQAGQTSSGTGSLTIQGGVSGVLDNSNVYGGSIYDATTTLDFSYTRAGTTLSLTITGGSFTALYYIPGPGAGSFSEPVGAGAAPVILRTDPATAGDCSASQSVSYELTGEATVLGSGSAAGPALSGASSAAAGAAQGASQTAYGASRQTAGVWRGPYDTATGAAGPVQQTVEQSSAYQQVGGAYSQAYGAAGQASDPGTAYQAAQGAAGAALQTVENTSAYQTANNAYSQAWALKWQCLTTITGCGGAEQTAAAALQTVEGTSAYQQANNAYNQAWQTVWSLV